MDVYQLIERTGAHYARINDEECLTRTDAIDLVQDLVDHAVAHF